MSERFIPLTPGTDQNQLLAILNKNFGELDSEATTKAFTGPGGIPIIVEGKLPYSNGFGSLYYDTNGVARILIGLAPDGTVGLFVSKPGQDVLSAFS